MLKEREYSWEIEVGDNSELAIITAWVSGYDVPARGPSYSHGGLPAEYRDVYIVAIRKSDKVDITDSLSESEVSNLEEHALELDTPDERY